MLVGRGFPAAFEAASDGKGTVHTLTEGGIEAADKDIETAEENELG
jgi:hypothetical protein